MLNVEYKTMGQVNILLYYGGPRDEGKEEGGGGAGDQGCYRSKNDKGEKILHGQGKVREFHFESGKI